MSEKKYQVLNERMQILADNMSLEMALLFMKAYTQEYYNEHINLTLSERLNKEK